MACLPGPGDHLLSPLFLSEMILIVKYGNSTNAVALSRTLLTLYVILHQKSSSILLMRENSGKAASIECGVFYQV
jgi:hypothetical protein